MGKDQKKSNNRKLKPPFLGGFFSKISRFFTMGKTITIHNHIHLIESDEVSKTLKITMSSISELNAKVAELDQKVENMQAVIDAEQAQIQQLNNLNAQVVADLTDQKNQLQAQLDELIATGATPEALQAIIGAMDTTISKIQAATDDVESTVEG